MCDIVLSERIDEWRSLCISDLSLETLADCDALHLGGAVGPYLYLLDERPHEGGVSVIARVASVEAGLQLMDALHPCLSRSIRSSSAPATA